MTFAEPFAAQVNFQTGIISPVGKVTQRRISDMRGMFQDSTAVERILTDEGDRLVYEVHAADLPEEEGQILYCTTIIYPGRVGDEYHMTKGHFHTRRDRAETYLGTAGEGYLLLQLEDGTVRSLPMSAGTMAYIPPYWAHRTVNVGTTPFIFLSNWPGDAGHDYESIERSGFAKILVTEDGRPTLVNNPRYR